MDDFNALTDTLFREHAVERLDAFVAQHGIPDQKKITRTQLAGLLYVAKHQPLKVSDFAKDKANRCKKRGDEKGEEPETRFWYLVNELIESRPNQDRWSLRGEATARMPEEVQSRRQQQAFFADWLSCAIPLFISHFIAHYRYVNSTRP